MRQDSDYIDARPFTRSLALVVGVDRYLPGVPPLANAGSDARAIAEMLRDDHGYEVTLLLNSEASKEKLLEALDLYLKADLTSSDRMLFYFAGHGIAVDSDEGPTGYILPQDARSDVSASFLAMEELNARLLKLGCLHMLIILDCCFAGALRWSSVRTMMGSSTRVFQERYKRYVSYAAWQVIVSASQDERAFDSLGGRGNRGAHSPFAAALLEGLKGAADVTPAGGDGLITATELYLYLREQVQTRSFLYGVEQTPALWPLRKHDKGEYVFAVPGRALSLPPAPELDEGANPWRGLQSYDSNQAEIFFGRDAAVEDLLPRITEGRFCVILGPSGSGKSSLVKAGIGKRLQLMGWTILPIVRPGPLPLAELNHVLADVPEHQQTLLIVDQLEELVTQCFDAIERETFLLAIAHIIGSSSNIHVLATLRNGFEPAFSDSALYSFWLDARYILRAMTRIELRQAIEGPAEKAVLHFEPSSLIDDIMDEVIESPGSLPLLSFVLSELYRSYLLSVHSEAEAGRALTKSAYIQLGGVVGCLSRKASFEYERGDRLAIQSMLLRMVTFEAGLWAKRRVTQDELHYESEDENTRIEVERQRYIDARLLVEGAMPDGAPYVEPAHEELIQGWPLLRGWVRQSADQVILHRRLTQGAFDWHRSHRRSSLLWNRDPRLPQAVQLATQRYLLNAQEKTFVKKSESKRLLERNLWIAGITLSVVVAFGLAMFYRNQQQIQSRLRKVALAQSLSARAGTIQAQGRHDELAGLLARQAFLLNRSVDGPALAQIDDGLRTILSAPNLSSEVALSDWRSASIAYSQDGSELRTISEGGEIFKLPILPSPRDPEKIYVDLNANRTGPRKVVWSEKGPVFAWIHRNDRDGVAPESVAVLRDGDKQPYYLPLAIGSQPSALDISGDGRRVAIATSDGSIQIHEVAQLNSPPWTLRRPQEKFYEIALSYNGDLLAFLGKDGFVWLYDTRRPQKPKKLQGRHEKWVYSLAFDSTGRWLASGGEERIVRLWDLHAPAIEPRISKPHIGGVYSIAFSKDGSLIACGSNDQRLSTWETFSFPMGETTLANGTTGVASLAFDPSARSFASSGDDGRLRVWSLARSPGIPIQWNTGTTVAQAIEIDQSSIFVGGTDGLVRLWNLAKIGSGVRSFKATDWVTSLILIPEHNFLVVSTDKDVEVHDLRNSTMFSISDHQATSLDRDKRWLAAGARDADTLIWEISNLERKPATASTEFDELSFGYAPGVLAGITRSGNVQLYDVQEGHESRQIPLPSNNSSELVSIAATSGRIAVGSKTGGILLWSAKDGWKRLEGGQSSQILTLRFSPMGDLLASGGEDGQVLLWDLNRIGDRPVVLRGEKAIWTLRFTPDGEMIAGGDDEGNVYLWMVRTEQLASRVCEYARRNLTVDEWNQFLGADLDYENTCSNLPPGRGPSFRAR